MAKLILLVSIPYCIHLANCSFCVLDNDYKYCHEIKKLGNDFGDLMQHKTTYQVYTVYQCEDICKRTMCTGFVFQKGRGAIGKQVFCDVYYSKVKLVRSKHVCDEEKWSYAWVRPKTTRDDVD